MRSGWNGKSDFSHLQCLLINGCQPQKSPILGQFGQLQRPITQLIVGLHSTIKAFSDCWDRGIWGNRYENCLVVPVQFYQPSIVPNGNILGERPSVGSPYAQISISKLDLFGPGRTAVIRESQIGFKHCDWLTGVRARAIPVRVIQNLVATQK